ncbi:MAG: hypothetical protein KF802_16045 [Bdellovibrionaceae bacterium]|nr:hypothetical protein [Pseudobdellovibrionaceae bacterium]
MYRMDVPDLKDAQGKINAHGAENDVLHLMIRVTMITPINQERLSEK